ncbi:MAG: exo-alpha-sialidase, partial [Candidatus Poribacteria bacterium]
YISSIDENQIKEVLLETSERVVAVKGGGYFPVLIKLNDGTIGAVVRGGAPHIGIKGRLDWISSDDGGKTWSEPSIIVDSQYDDRNPALGQMKDGTIVMAYAEASTYNDKGDFDTSIGSYDMYYVISKDNGKTWSEKIKLPHGPIKNGSPYGRIILLPDGTALMSAYGSYDNTYIGNLKVPQSTKNVVCILRSKDNGKTWGDFSIISGTDHNETAIAYMPDGRLIAMMRTYKDAYLEQTESVDGGYTWDQSKPVTSPNQHPADLCLLSDNRLLLVYGNRNKPYGVGAMISNDAGKTWESNRRFMIGWTSLNTDCGYPSAVRLDDGAAVIMYYSVGTSDISSDAMAIAVIDHEQNILTDQTEWTRKGSLGITPKHPNDDYPMSDQDNKGNWTKYETMSDEFNGDEPNADKWTKKMYWWKGRQPALFMEKNVIVNDGKLHLIMQKEDIPEESKQQGYHDYSSAIMLSKTKTCYGYFEVKAKPMNSAGSSSFWFQNEELPNWFTEIDVFEIGGKSKNYEYKYNMNCHVFQTPEEKRHWSIGGVWIAPWRLADDYHIYGLEWDEDWIKYYVDGVLVRKMKNTHWHQPLYMIFDSETMPDWFGMPEDADLPSTYSIEYVRAWKKQPK